MVHEARDRLSTRIPHLVFEVADAQNIPHGQSQFDAIIANHMLYHVNRPGDTLSEIRRVLRPGGRFYATTVGKGHMRELGQLLKEFTGRSDAWEDTVPGRFVLEDGAGWLSRCFSHATLRYYEDALEITEADPLVRYAVSVVGDAVLAGTDLTRFTRFVEDRLEKVGVIKVTKETGLFEATNVLSRK